MARRKPVATTIDEDVIDIPPEDITEVSDGVTMTADGGITVEQDDGSIIIDPTGSMLWQGQDDEDDEDSDFDENLALKVDVTELGRIAEDLLTAIDQDKSDRSQWVQTRARCLELLGLKIEDPRSDVSRSSMGLSTSSVRDPILLEAVERFRAGAYAEMCPSSGPVKVERFGEMQSLGDDDLATSLQDDLNYFLTVTAAEYYPDTDFMLWWVGLAGGMFKKVYRCPLRQRPVSESVDGTSLIVPSNATDLQNALRVTHEVTMSKADMRAMQIQGVYRDTNLSEALAPQINPLEAKKATIEGVTQSTTRPEDQEYTIYECYCRLDIKGYEHQNKGKASGLPLPYRVTIDTTSREVLEIRRNWAEEDDEKVYKVARIPFVLFTYSTGLSRIYGSGLGQMGGNLAMALTALMRISIDNGMLSNYPGLIKAKSDGRQVTNELMVPPGGVAELDVGTGMRIQDVVMPMPFKDVSTNVMQFSDQLRNVGQRLLGSAELPVGEGNQDAPVGTTLAMIEQAAKIMSAVHKRLHRAQDAEIKKLVELLREDPNALWENNPTPKFGSAKSDIEKQARVDKFLKALEQYNIVPMSDPNVPSDMHRNLMAMGFQNLVTSNPMTAPAFDHIKVARYISKQVFKMSDSMFNSLLAPPPPPGAQPPPDPIMIKLGIEKQLADTKQIEVQTKADLGHATLESKNNIAALQIAAKTTGEGKSAVDPNAGKVTQAQAAELGVKHRKLDLDEQSLALKAHNEQANREMKTTVEALKVAQATSVHPLSDPIVDQQLHELSPLITPPSRESGMADGGAVNDDGVPEEVKRALDIAAAVRELQHRTGYLQ